MNRSTVNGNVRRAAKFCCELCGTFSDNQNAHIIPDSDNGVYSFDNLVWLCYPCHRKTEPTQAPSGSKQYLQLIKQLKKIKSSKKQNKFLKSFFYFPSESLVVHIGNNEFVNCPTIFAYPLPFSDPVVLLGIEMINGLLVINALFYDQAGNLILHINKNKFSTKSCLCWDLELKRGSLKIISNDRSMNLTIKQNNDCSLSITGQIFYFKNNFELSDKKGLVTQRFVFNSCKFANNSAYFQIDEHGQLSY